MSATAERHARFPGLFIVKRTETNGFSDGLVTKISNSQPVIFTNERIDQVTADTTENQQHNTSESYRTWNPFRSPIAAAIVGGVEKLLPEINDTSNQGTTTNVLYLGSALTTSAVPLAEMIASSSPSSSTNVLLPILFQNLDSNLRTYTASEIEHIQRSIGSTENENEWGKKIETDLDRNGEIRNWEMKAEDFVDKYFSNTIDNVAAPSKEIPPTLAKPIIVADSEQEQIHGSKLYDDIADFITEHQKKLRMRGNAAGRDTEEQNFFDSVIVEIWGADQKTLIENLVAPIAESFLKPGATFVLLIDAADQVKQQTEDAHKVYAKAVDCVRHNGFKPREQVTLEPFFRNKAILISVKK